MLAIGEEWGYTVPYFLELILYCTGTTCVMFVRGSGCSPVHGTVLLLNLGTWLIPCRLCRHYALSVGVVDSGFDIFIFTLVAFLHSIFDRNRTRSLHDAR